LFGYRAYVHAATREVLPLALIEALAAGLPIVAGAIGGIPELFDPGVEGAIWPLDDPDAAARVLIGLLEDEKRLARSAAAAAARFSREFDAAVAGPALEAFLLSLPTDTTAEHANGGSVTLHLPTPTTGNRSVRVPQAPGGQA
jgi:glycosyltransferase involved in cell wall biosynthesis